MGRSSLGALEGVAGLALVAPTLKVLYLPTPKAACTTIKLMLATAEGTHRPDLADRMAIMHVSRAQTIHHPRVHGLRSLAEVPSRQRRTILESPDWLRIASLRDPVARAYSAWENRIFLRAHRRSTTLIEIAHDVHTDGKVDIATSFAHFARMLGERTDPFMADHHFQPQVNLVRPDLVDYSRLVRVDEPGGIDALAALLSERSGRSIEAKRLNEGLGVKVGRVCDADTANRLMATYASDYAAFGFAPREWSPSVEPLLLGDLETRLLNQYRSAFERAVSVARESQRRVGPRYAVSQLRRSMRRFARLDFSPTDPREIMW